MLVAGKALGEEVANGAAARPVVAAREGRARRREFDRRERLKKQIASRGQEPSGRAVDEPSSSESATSSWSIPSRGPCEPRCSYLFGDHGTATP